MASVDCHLISPQSPLHVLFVEPVREGFYSIYHGGKDYYALYEKCVAKGRFPELTEFYWGTVHILTGLSLLAFPFNAIIFQIFVSVAGSYQEALRDAVDNEKTETVKFYLSLGVTPNNIYDTKPLIYRTKKREILEALINAGADLSRTYSGMTFLEYLINEGMEDLAEAHLDRLSVNESMYANAIRKRNWPVAVFLVRMGRASLFNRDQIQATPKTTNPLEMIVIKGDAVGLADLSLEHGLTAMKGWVDELQERFPRMKMDWIWTAILSVYCQGSARVSDETIYELFKYGPLQGEENPLRFEKKDFISWAALKGRETLVNHLASRHFLAMDDFSRLSKSMYEDAIRKRNWPVAAFFVRIGQATLLGREQIQATPKSDNPIEMAVIQADPMTIANLYKEQGLAKIKVRAHQLQERFSLIKIDWIWTAILSVYWQGDEEVSEEEIYELFKCGALHGEENPLGFEKSNFIYWICVQGRSEIVDHLIRDRLLTVDSSDFEELLKDSRNRRTFFDFAIRLGYRGTPEEVRQNRYQCKSENPLEGIVATQNAARLETFVESRSFEEFYRVYLELKTLFPNMHTGWMWNVIYEIPQSHFDQFTPIQTSATITSPPPSCYPLSDLLAVFDQINFDDPRKGHFIEKKALSETLDSTPTYRTPTDIRKGLGNIIEALQTGKKVYKLLPEEVEGYRLQIQWIIHLLKAGLKSGPLPRHKANVLIDMGKACLMCPGRYNDIFDIAIKRLKNEEVAVVSFEDQLQRYFADLRSKILNRVAFKIAKGCVHSWENLVYHLHDERALQEPKPHRIMSTQLFHDGEGENYHFVFKSDAREAFDDEYNPEELMGVLSEFARVDRKRSEQENDFNELMMDAMVEAYSTQFPAIQDLEHRMKVRVPGGILFEDQVLPLEEVESLFKPIDPHYWISTSEETATWTVAKHFADFKQAHLAYQIRPLRGETPYGYILPEVIHPLVMGKVLCDLGHLEQRITFRVDA